MVMIFGVKVQIYPSDYGKSSEKPFRSAIEYFNQKITFCALGSHHQNVIVERKVQTITLGAKTIAST